MPRSLRGRVILTEHDLWPGKRIVTILRTTVADSLTAEFLFQDLAGPDVWVYWVPSERFSGGALPGNAQLLEPLSSQATLSLPKKPGEIGRFVLYSVANHEIVATSKPLNVPPHP
jgi:hypothetical protein